MGKGLFALDRAQTVLLGLGGLASLLGCQSDPVRPKPSLEATRAHFANEPVAGAPSAGAEPAASETKAASPSSEEDNALIARAAGQAIYLQDLVQAWLFRDSSQAREVLDRLVLDKLVQAEALRFGVRLDPGLVAEDWAATLGDFDAQVAQSDPGATRESFIQSRLGLDPESYLAAMANRRRLDLLAARCVRAFALESDAIEARLIVAPDRKTADLVEAGLASGKSFAELAKQYSSDPSAEQGGWIPPIVRSMAPIARLAFATPIGEVGGPLKEEGRFLFLQADAFREGAGGAWSRLGPLVEQSLATRGIEDLEFVQWQAMALARYEVDTRPLLHMLSRPAK
ncbi:MAG: peptidylprolyl isomerase [Planctomycetes bacterium]|nr:peptidylprolyl isomerase [Planctomycetota bacterium]MCB9908733.1 peptidylprolyl isomerase [Planctomycetota bacterium]MCB9912442.1 peptidylprolyl isomerase [Planctomycetota bacterium]HPF14865.1 peptidylprolyl isomerase [Planctomycetota bacterium]